MRRRSPFLSIVSARGRLVNYCQLASSIELSRSVILEPERWPESDWWMMRHTRADTRSYRGDSQPAVTQIKHNAQWNRERRDHPCEITKHVIIYIRTTLLCYINWFWVKCIKRCWCMEREGKSIENSIHSKIKMKHLNISLSWEKICRVS